MSEAMYYERVEVTGAANSEVVVAILTSTEEEHKHLVFFSTIEVTAVENHDAIIAGYIEREKVVDMAYVSTLRQHDTDIRLESGFRIILNHDLPVGESFRIGHLSGATPSTIEYLVGYTIE